MMVFDEWNEIAVEELAGRLESLASRLRTGESTIGDTLDGIDHLLDGLPARDDKLTIDQSEDKEEQALSLVKEFAGKVKIVDEYRESALNDSLDSLHCASSLYLAIEEARDLIDGSIELQDALINPDEYGVISRDMVIGFFDDTCNEALEVLARSDSNVLNEHIAGEWLKNIDTQIIGGVEWLLSPRLHLREINGRLVVDARQPQYD